MSWLALMAPVAFASGFLTGGVAVATAPGFFVGGFCSNGFARGRLTDGRTELGVILPETGVPAPGPAPTAAAAFGATARLGGTDVSPTARTLPGLVAAPVFRFGVAAALAAADT